MHSVKDVADKAKQCLEDGKMIVVLGWRGQSHTTFTRDLPKKKVMFLDKDADVAFTPECTGIALSTRLLSHAEANRLHRLRGIRVHKMNPGQIKQVLELCRDQLLAPPHANGSKNKVETVDQPAPSEPPKDTPPDTDPGTQGSEQDKELAFALAWGEASDFNPDNCLTRGVTLGLLRAVFQTDVRSARPYTDSGLLEGVVEEGKQRATCYRAAPRLRDMLAPSGESDKVVEEADPAPETVASLPEKTALEKLEELLASKESLLQKQHDLKVELSEIQAKLDKISTAENLQAQILSLVE